MEIAAEPGSSIASKEELDSLTDHFKDVGFQEYALLNDDCKRHIIGCLDSRALVRLGMCSKNDQRLTAEFPLKITAIRFSNLNDNTMEEFEEYEAFLTMEVFPEYETVQFKLDDGFNRTMYFRQSGTDVVVEKKLGHLFRKQENSDYSKEAVKLFENLLKRSHYGVENITLQMGREAQRWALRDGSPVESLPKVQVAMFNRMISDNLKLWLKKIPDHLESLELHIDVTSDILELPQFRNARVLQCKESCDVTDAELLDLQAVHIHIPRAPLLTTRGVNAFLKRWQEGGGVDGFRKLEISTIGQFVHRLNVNFGDIIEGLDATELETARDGALCYEVQNKVRPTEKLNVQMRRWLHIRATVLTGSQ